MTTLTRLWHQFWRDLLHQHRHHSSGPRLSRAAVRNSKRGR